jgi:hypothetical protein
MICRFVDVLECIFNISDVLFGCLGVPPMGLRRDCVHACEWSLSNT